MPQSDFDRLVNIALTHHMFPSAGRIDACRSANRSTASLLFFGIPDIPEQM